MRIIDSQVHPYAPRGPADAAPPGQRMLTPGAIIAEMDSAGVDGAVLVPPRVDLTTNDYALQEARRWPDRFAVMGKLLMDHPESPDAAAAWTPSQMLGFRVSFPPNQLSPADVDWFWRSAEERDFPVMVWAPMQLRALGEVARRYPRARIIVDHLGLAPDDRGDDVRRVITDLLPLATYDNVAVKASSLPAHSTQTYPFEDLHAYVRMVVSAFGPSRVFWGSDLTTLSCPYEEAVRMFTDAIGFSASDLEQIMGQGIEKWLRWTV